MIGRWSAIDKYADKYALISPYQYVGNNPIKSVDSKGDSIIIVGPRGSDFVAKLNSESSVQYRLSSTNKLVPINPNDANDFFSGYMVGAAGSNSQDITFNNVDQDSKVLVDQYTTGKVDMDDLNALNGEAYQASLIHFTAERYATSNYDTNTHKGERKTFYGAHSNGNVIESNYLSSKHPNKKNIKAGEDRPGHSTDKFEPAKLDSNGNGTQDYVFDFGDIQIIFTQPVVNNQTKDDVQKAAIKQ